MRILSAILVQLATGANIATILLLWACCGITYISPETAPRLSLLGLAFPLFLGVNVAFVFFWLIFKWKRVWLPLAGLAVCFSYVRDYIPVNIPSPAPKGTLKVLSFNSHNLGGKEAIDDQGHNAVIDYLSTSDADIICLQESSMSGKRLDEYVKTMQTAGYHHYNNKSSFIFSRLPILETGILDLPTRGNEGVWAYLSYGRDTVLLINHHFESNRLTPSEKDAYKDAIDHPRKENAKEDIMPVLRHLSKAAPMRAQQTDSIVKIIQQWQPRPVILCCDMNDTPISYNHRRMKELLDNAFRESASGVGFTYYERGFPVRIDHIFYSRDYWKSFSTRVDEHIKWSDHYPISTQLMPKTQK